MEIPFMYHINKSFCYLLAITMLGLLLNGCSPAVKKKENNDQGKVDGRPEVNSTGPQPQLVINVSEYQFGSMLVGDKRKHTFEIHNKGEGVLKLFLGPTSCSKCTKYTLIDKEVSPGSSTKVVAEWFPHESDAKFRKFAPLYSNDGKLQKIELVLSGNVTEKLELSGDPEWIVPPIEEGKPSSITRYLYSTVLDKFELKEVKSVSPSVTSKFTTMTPEELKTYQAKCGYAIVISVSEKIGVGKYTERLEIKTDVKEKSSMAVYVQGSRAGPFRFQAMPGIAFYANTMYIDMKEVDGTEGFTGKLQMFTKEIKENPFKIVSAKSNSEFLKVTVKKDEKFKSKTNLRFIIHFEIPPGTPAVNHSEKESVHIVITTNRPDAKEIKLRVAFIVE